MHDIVFELTIIVVMTHFTHLVVFLVLLNLALTGCMHVHSLMSPPNFADAFSPYYFLLEITQILHRTGLLGFLCQF